MRKKIVYLGLSLFTAVFTSQANEYSAWGGIGQGKENISLEVGFRMKNIGVNIYNAGNYDYSKGEVEAIPPPHTIYTRENDKKVGNAGGIEGMYFLDIKNISFFFEAGINIQEYRDIAISNNDWDKGTIYTLDRQTRLNFSYGIGTQIKFNSLLVGIEFNNSKGIMGLIGLQW